MCTFLAVFQIFSCQKINSTLHKSTAYPTYPLFLFFPFCIIGIQSVISTDIILKNGVILAPRSNLSSEDVEDEELPYIIPDKTSIYGENSEIWREMSEMPKDNRQQIIYLRGLLPKHINLHKKVDKWA